MSSTLSTQKIEYPYPIVLIDNVFGPDGLKKIQKLADEILWKRISTTFYDQHEFTVVRSDETFPVFSLDRLHQIKADLEKHFECEYYDFVEINFHKLIADQYINIHTDTPLPGYESVRLVVGIDEDYSGGFFHAFDSEHKISSFDLKNGKGLAFTLSENSYHAVTKVTEGSRLTAILSFWQRDCELNLDELATRGLYFLGDQRVSRQLDFLREIGCHRTAHTGRDLFSHLYETYLILDRWNVDDDVKLAGLFHSVLNPAITSEMDAQVDKAMLETVIGKRAANLAERFAKRWFTPHSPGNVMDATDDDYCLWLIDCANSLEQLRIEAKEEKQRICATYLKHSNKLPENAIRDLLHCLA